MPGIGKIVTKSFSLNLAATLGSSTEMQNNPRPHSRPTDSESRLLAFNEFLMNFNEC